MKHDYSLAHLTVLSLAPPQVVEVAARAGYRYVGLRATRVTPDEVLYDLAHDRALMRETKARLAYTGIEELAALPREWFRFAHVCDAAKEVPPTMAGIIRTARDERQFPGEGGIDVRGILAAMPQDIPYALEIPRVALTSAVGPEEVARLAVTVARSHLDNDYAPAPAIQRPPAARVAHPYASQA